MATEKKQVLQVYLEKAAELAGVRVDIDSNGLIAPLKVSTQDLMRLFDGMIAVCNLGLECEINGQPAPYAVPYAYSYNPWDFFGYNHVTALLKLFSYAAERGDFDAESRIYYAQKIEVLEARYEASTAQKTFSLNHPFGIIKVDYLKTHRPLSTYYQSVTYKGVEWRDLSELQAEIDKLMR